MIGGLRAVGVEERDAARRALAAYWPESGGQAVYEAALRTQAAAVGAVLVALGVTAVRPSRSSDEVLRLATDAAETAMTDDGHRMPRSLETRYLATTAARAILDLVKEAQL